MKRSRIALLFRYFIALAFGLLVGVVLVTSYAYFPEAIQESNYLGTGGSPFLTPRDFAQIAAGYSVLSGIIIELVCTPIWLLIGRFAKQSYGAAAALGFIATFSAWIFFFHQGVLDQVGVQSALPISACGACAGMACWWKSPARPAQ